ncbi:hypothetical protein K32_10770 [Kaistia sp. 32K]|uniref:DUF29 domain-containing protein n=1 Tax=Kaistia sp. 32K TaxID=2795690 RepID=UPI0019151F0A|nr:DUF29 domain-containing protein [Kaistia sp. 32K]BCP52460.1 hypothetical protein K32_10770 [Kaistia sp. 32K]
MGLAKEKPLYETPTDYEDDLNLWLLEQIELLRQKRINEVDLPNLIEELEDMGSEQRHALESSYRLVISHLLKWHHQPEQRSSSWEITIFRERANIERREKRSRSLKADAGWIVADIYRYALREAAIETGLPRESFPAECPWTIEQLRDPDFLPA